MEKHMGDLDEAVGAAIEGAAESRLNSIVAVLVALAATAMALDNIKDGNVTQAMAQAQTHAVDAWSYYQAKSTKQNLAEATIDELQVVRSTATSPAAQLAEVDKKIAAYQAQVARYEKEKADVKAEAEGFQREYDRLNLHDDQFDLSDAGFSVAIALLGVTALTRKRWLLAVAAVFLLVGTVFGVAGFLNWSLHPDRLMSWLS
jgi:chromosome segregation ATPase